MDSDEQGFQKISVEASVPGAQRDAILERTMALKIQRVQMRVKAAWCSASHLKMPNSC